MSNDTKILLTIFLSSIPIVSLALFIAKNILTGEYSGGFFSMIWTKQTGKKEISSPGTNIIAIALILFWLLLLTVIWFFL